MLLLVLLLILLSLIIYHLSSNHSIGSRLRNVSNTKSFLLPTTLSSFPIPLTSVHINHLAQPARLPLSLFSVHPSVLASNSLVVLSAILPLYFGTIPPSMRQPSSKSSSQTLSQPNSTKPQPLALSRSLFHSTLKTLLFSRSHPYHAPT
jgi:hypothetical protein